LIGTRQGAPRPYRSAVLRPFGAAQSVTPVTLDELLGALPMSIFDARIREAVNTLIDRGRVSLVVTESRDE